MLSYDAEIASQVWERVHAGREEPPQHQDLPGLIAAEHTTAAAYLRLSKHFRGKEAALLQRLAEEEKSHGACLQGIHTLLSGQKAAVIPPASHHETLRGALQRCYRQSLYAAAEYEKRSTHPEFGPVFARFAAQEREHCCSVLALIGKLPDKI